MHFLSHTLVLLLAFVPALPAGAFCGSAPANEQACESHLNASAAPAADEACEERCADALNTTCCEAAPAQSDPVVPVTPESQLSHVLDALPASGFIVGEPSRPQESAVDESHLPRGPTLQSQHVRLQV